MSQQGEETYAVYNVENYNGVKDALDDLGVSYQVKGEITDSQERVVLGINVEGPEPRHRGLDSIAEALKVRGEIGSVDALLEHEAIQ